jgi:hypothetical protein
MALSRETLISMVKNEYPSSYSSDVEKMSHEDLMDLLDYLDSIKGKADGGAIGIEVLFGPKRKKFNMGGGQFTSGGNISPGTDTKGNIRDDNPFTGGGGNNKPPVVITNKPPLPIEID